MEEFWTFGPAPRELRRRHPPLRSLHARHTVSGWLNETARAGFLIEDVGDPQADEATAAAHPEVGDTRILPTS